MLTRWIIFGLITAAIAALGAIAAHKAPPRQQAAEQSPYIDLPADQRAAIGDLIRGSGYVCPSVNNVKPAGYGPRGAVFRIWCGPAGSADMIAGLVYRLDQHPDGWTSARPWEGDPHRMPGG